MCDYSGGIWDKIAAQYCSFCQEYRLDLTYTFLGRRFVCEESIKVHKYHIFRLLFIGGYDKIKLFDSYENDP